MSSTTAARAHPVLLLTHLLLLPLLLLLLGTLSIVSVHAAVKVTPYVRGSSCHVTDPTLPAISLADWHANVSAPCVPYTTPNGLFATDSPSWLAIDCRVPSVSLYYYSVNGSCPWYSAEGGQANFTYTPLLTDQCNSLFWQRSWPTRSTGVASTIFQCSGTTTSASSAMHNAHDSQHAIITAALLFALLVAGAVVDV